MQYGRVKDAAPYSGGAPKRPPSTTRDGVGTAALRHTPRGLRHLRMALWDDGGFRAVRGAGVSPAAAGDRGRCPLDPCDFLKKIE